MNARVRATTMADGDGDNNANGTIERDACVFDARARSGAGCPVVVVFAFGRRVSGRRARDEWTGGRGVRVARESPIVGAGHSPSAAARPLSTRRPLLSAAPLPPVARCRPSLASAGARF